MAAECDFCGTPDSPCRNVPAPIPFSTYYCDDCAEACRIKYEKIFWEEYFKHNPRAECEFERSTPGGPCDMVRIVGESDWLIMKGEECVLASSTPEGRRFLESRDGTHV